MSTECLLGQASDVLRVLDEVDVILCDCDGVLYLSQTRISGADEAIRKLRQKGKKVIFVTNNGAVSRKTAIAKLNKLGFEADADELFTPSFAVAQYLKAKHFTGTVS